jgi:hypothetical protein
MIANRMPVRVLALTSGMRAKINLIALNPGPGIAFRSPAEANVLKFQSHSGEWRVSNLRQTSTRSRHLRCLRTIEENHRSDPSYYLTGQISH